jgi:hypothetical protein
MLTRAWYISTHAHDVALRIARLYVVDDTPSITPPRWFLVMSVLFRPCHCPQSPFLRASHLKTHVLQVIRRERGVAL